MLSAGTTATCTGDQSDGIASDPTYPAAGDFPDSYTTLNVNTLDTDIAPDPDVDGINFTGTGPVTINSNTGPHRIITTGTAAGIYAFSPSDPVLINHTGDIVGTGGATDIIYGMRARSRNLSGDAGSTTIVSSGDVALTISDVGLPSSFSRVTGFQVYSYSSSGLAGPVSITSNGDVTVSVMQDAGGTSAGGFGALSYSVPGPTGSLSIDSTGNIAATAISGNGNAFVNGMAEKLARAKATSAR